MKIEVVLRKAAPFLLIAILIACLFSMPQKEGMKSAKHWFEKHDGKNTEDIVLGSTGTAIGAAAAKVGHMTWEGHQWERQLKAEAKTAQQEERERAAREAAKEGKAKARKDFGDTYKKADMNHFSDEMDGLLAHTVDDTKSRAANFGDEARDSVVRSSADTVNMFKDEASFKHDEIDPLAEAIDIDDLENEFENER